MRGAFQIFSQSKDFLQLVIVFQTVEVWETVIDAHYVVLICIETHAHISTHFSSSDKSQSSR